MIQIDIYHTFECLTLAETGVTARSSASVAMSAPRSWHPPHIQRQRLLVTYHPMFYPLRSLAFNTTRNFSTHKKNAGKMKRLDSDSGS